jgi:hypothetical protein
LGPTSLSRSLRKSRQIKTPSGSPPTVTGSHARPGTSSGSHFEALSLADAATTRPPRITGATADPIAGLCANPSAS